MNDCCKETRKKAEWAIAVGLANAIAIYGEAETKDIIEAIQDGIEMAPLFERNTQ